MASVGTIVVNTYTSRAQIPVEGASVLFRRDEPPYTLLGFRITDSSGKTQPLSIPTPDLKDSQAPNSEVLPFQDIIVQAEHPDFERVILRGVQLFPGITTIQNIPMLPMQSQDPEKDQVQDIQFTPQPL